MKNLSLLMMIAAPLTLGACDSGGDTGDTGMADDSTSSGTGDDSEAGSEAGESSGEEGSTEPVDSDEDGLTDEEEAELGTDPNLKDTDDDTYWDGWEVDEGTNPLDPESRIYIGYWPYNPNKEDLEQGTWANAGSQVGKSLPRADFLDQNDQLVDMYDFGANDKYQIMDVSAQWCGPCHNVADWLAGADNSNTAFIQEAYPTVRDKVHDYTVMWITFIGENQSGGVPTLQDATSWASQHWDPYVPVLVDDTQGMRDRFIATGYPTMFITGPDMKVNYFPTAGSSTNANPYPALGFVDGADF